MTRVTTNSGPGDVSRRRARASDSIRSRQQAGGARSTIHRWRETEPNANEDILFVFKDRFHIEDPRETLVSLRARFEVLRKAAADFVETAD